jgi:hypothetical protein
VLKDQNCVKEELPSKVLLYIKPSSDKSREAAVLGI